MPRSHPPRDDLPQVVIGMAVTRTGIPIRVWSWAGNTNDQALIREVKDDLADWRLGHVIWVADRGFSSAENRRYLQRAGGNYIIGEKIGGNTEAALVLARPGRFHEIRHNMRVKEVVSDDGAARDRFVICHNPEQAERNELIRTQLVDRLQEAIDGTDQATHDERTKLATGLPGAVRRYLHTTKTGLLRVGKTAIRNEAKLDGKYLLRTADPSLSIEDIALGYKQLLEAERGWRDMKSTLDLRPVYHRLEDRIRPHVILCWLALLHIRIIETRTNQTWTNIRHQLDQMHLGTFTGAAGTIRRRTTTSTAQQKILAAVGLKEPAAYTSITPNTPT
ncbi:MAG: transposase [Candidatus Microthrix parvicella]